MKNRTHIITLAAIALTRAAALTNPVQAQIAGDAAAGGGGAIGVPNVTMPGDSVRQGAAGINSAEAEATRTTGNATADTQARAENEIARTGLPSSAEHQAPGAARNTQDRIGGTEEQITQQLNREQTAKADVSANVSTR